MALDASQRKLIPFAAEQSSSPAENGLAGSNGKLRLLQITDCHLGERVGEQLAGMDTDASLDYVLGQIQAEYRCSEGNRADLLLATGDLANHGTKAAYERLQEKLATLPMPAAWLPGNHDEIDKMLQVVSEQKLPGVVLAAGWAIIMLDSTIPGKVEGKIGSAELARLTDVLQKLPADCHIMICLHHQVLPVGSRWLDHQQIADSDELLELLASETRLKLVVSGHVHQEFSQQYPDLPHAEFLASPSTCIQFAPATEDFKIDEQLPGYRWFELHDDGSYQTGVSRIETADLTMDLASSGY